MLDAQNVKIRIENGQMTLKGKVKVMHFQEMLKAMLDGKKMILKVKVRVTHFQKMLKARQMQPGTDGRHSVTVDGTSSKDKG